jgi:tRNA-binding protein
VNAERCPESSTFQLLLLEVEIIPFTMTTTKPTPVKQSVTIDVLNEIDIRVGTIDLVEEVKGSDKLVKLTVNFGDHKRSILVGMRKERQEPKEVEGKQALFIVNLEPKRMFGELSEGMLLDIGYADGITPVLAVPERPVPNGTRAG